MLKRAKAIVENMPRYCYVVYVRSPDDDVWVPVYGQFATLKEVWHKLLTDPNVLDIAFFWHGIRIRKTVSFKNQLVNVG